MKRALGRVALVAALACAAEPSRAPMEWASVHPEAIAAWKAANHAPDGVAVDVAARTVRILVEATGLGPADTAEFFAIGPLSDRAYESFFVTVASPAAIADAIERAGVPRGVPPDIAGARLWPCGEKLTLSATPVSTNAQNLAFSDLLNDTAEKEEGAILSAPVVYTGGARDASGAVVAATNIPCAVFALYSHTPTIVRHTRTGYDCTNRHIEMDADHIALFPVAVENHVTVFQFAVHFLTIDGNLIGAEDIVVVGIEVAGYNLALYPSRNANHHIKGFGLILDYLDGNITIPRIVGLLLDGHVLASQSEGGCIGSKEVYVKIIVSHTIDIAWH